MIGDSTTVFKNNKGTNPTTCVAEIAAEVRVATCVDGIAEGATLFDILHKLRDMETKTNASAGDGKGNEWFNRTMHFV